VSSQVEPAEGDVWLPGSHAERTALAWVRTSISVFVSAAAAARVAALDDLVLLEALAGFGERSESGWTEAIIGLLAAGDDVRARLGAVARRGVEQHYSFARWAATWRAAVLG